MMKAVPLDTLRARMGGRQDEYTLPLALTDHARRRMAQRGIREDDLWTAFRYGRRCHVRGACVYVVGRREVDLGRKEGEDLGRLEGIHMVCNDEGVVLTAYRNRQINVRDRTPRKFRIAKRRAVRSRGQR